MLKNNKRQRGGENIFIEDLFYDNVSVQGLNMNGNKEYKKRFTAMCELEKYLSENLKGKYLKAFLKFGETWNFIIELTAVISTYTESSTFKSETETLITYDYEIVNLINEIRTENSNQRLLTHGEKL